MALPGGRGPEILRPDQVFQVTSTDFVTQPQSDEAEKQFTRKQVRPLNILPERLQPIPTHMQEGLRARAAATLLTYQPEPTSCLVEINKSEWMPPERQPKRTAEESNSLWPRKPKPRSSAGSARCWMPRAGSGRLRTTERSACTDCEEPRAQWRITGSNTQGQERTNLIAKSPRQDSI